MPELPEVETVCNGLRDVILKRSLSAIKLQRADLRFPFPSRLDQVFLQSHVVDIYRRAKYILLNFDNGYTLLIHLGMSGRLLINPDEFSIHDHVIFDFSGCKIVYRDPRRFGYMDLCLTQDLSSHPYLLKLGIEPFDKEFSGIGLEKIFQNRKSSIKSLLLNQTLIVGLGNIYVCEALFLSGIHPKRLANQISPDEFKILASNIQLVLRNAIKAGGSSLKDYRQLNGTLGYFQHQFKVYDRENQPCSNCESSSRIKRIVQMGRSTFYCETCQF